MPRKAVSQVQKLWKKIRRGFIWPRNFGAIHVFYRLSDGGYDKIKPDYINNNNCLANFISNFSRENVTLIADNVKESTWNDLCEKYPDLMMLHTNYGDGAQSFNHALDLALELPQDDIIYFVEDDYLHRAGSRNIMLEGFSLGADYVTLYDHPDKFMDGVNPFIVGNGEVTTVFLSASCHWKLTNSTTMTFATTVSTLRKDEMIIRERTKTSHPQDFDLFIDLREKGRSLLSPLPGYSTHGEIQWLSPLVDWEKIASGNTQ